MSDISLVVMAAGMGSRYGGLKQIDPVGPSGEIVIDYSIYDALAAGFTKVVFIIREDIEEAFREKVGKSIEPRIKTEYVFQKLDNLPAGFEVPADRTKPWGTGHAVLCAKDAVDGPCAVINADDFYGAASFAAMGSYLAKAADTDVYDYSMVGFVLGNTLTDHGHVARGVCTGDAEDNLSAIVERTKIQRFGEGAKYTEDEENWVDIDTNCIVSMNMWGYTPSIFGELENRFGKFLDANMDNPKSEYFIPTVTNELIQEGKARVKILKTTERWHGVTYQEDKPKVKQAIGDMVAAGRYPQKLW